MELLSQTLRNVIDMKAKTFHRQQQQPTKPMDPIEYYISSHLMLELCECVEYLHTRHPKVIHRDLKPANILISDNPICNNNNNNSLNRFVKLGDFGLATDHNHHHLTTNRHQDSHTQCVGTLAYMAPEVIYSGKYNEFSDIYSLGLICKELFDINPFK
ncbi:uncharacterized protein LOC128964906 [Oppia nitens]|uniref:uncharacterized protein LOC128964906 n=1 Tax=Oppia nitens TaxID=1686743 RepID=UPI0023DC2BF5|nr:uncharacterized protein LOC128964906 [Oppia nitens]